jgi:CYTH domain-containing protein
MAVEIERKFLVRDDTWRSFVTSQHEIREGLIAVADGRKVRVRICDQEATLTVKSCTTGLANAEFEYKIPVADGEELLADHCLCGGLAKTRYFLPHGQLSWQVDVYKGMLAGVTLAEVELPSEMAEFPLPSWAGPEVTGDPAYRKINLVMARIGNPSSALQCLVSPAA